MIKLLSLILTLNGSVAMAETQRLDPHGSQSVDYKTVKDLKKYDQCTVCHVQKDGKILPKNSKTDVCTSCHNRAPHSGAADHVGKTHQGQIINCTSCHTPHRSENNMVKKTCTDCHQW